MAGKFFAGIGIFLFVFVFLLMSIVFVNAESSNNTISKTRCELVDSWLKPNSKLLGNHWNENVGSDCSG